MSDASAEAESTELGSFGGIKVSLLKLDGTNYPQWAFQILVIAHRYKAKTILEGKWKRPTAAGADQVKFDKLNESLYHLIYNTMNMDQQQLLRSLPIGDGQKSFQALENAYQPKTRAAVKHLLRSLLDLKQNDDTMAVYISKVTDIATRLEAALTTTGMSLIELLKIMVLLDGLAPQHTLLREQLTLEADITFDKATDACTLKAEQHSYEAAATAAAVTNEADAGYAKRSLGKPTLSKPYCKFCYNETGTIYNNHTEDNCTKKNPDLKRKPRGNNNGKHQYDDKNKSAANYTVGFGEAW